MVTFEALNALHGDCFLLRFGGGAEAQRIWVIDGGPRPGVSGDSPILVWRDVLLHRLRKIQSGKPISIDLAIVSHIDDDHIFGLDALAAKLATALPHQREVSFRNFWFNSFERLVGDDAAGASLAAMGGVQLAGAAAGATATGGEKPREADTAAAVLSSVEQGNSLALSLRELKIDGNFPFGGPVCTGEGSRPVPIDGAEVTVLGPAEKRLGKLRKLWAEAKSQHGPHVAQAELQELFAPRRRLDRSIPNLSSIVLLVEVEGKRLLLTGDARGDHVVEDWQALSLPDEKRRLDVLKVPHHGSWANNPRALFEFFEATHYVFSGDGRHGNPDPRVIEGVVELQGKRKITLHFTNSDVAWDEPHALKIEGRSARNLQQLLAELRIAYGGRWKASCRKPQQLSVAIKL